MLHYATERSDEEKKEIYDKWKSLINMSKKELEDWGEDPDHLEASLNREEAKDNGKIQSGYDSFHRIKRRKDKPFEDWTAQDFDNASQENGFNGRMLGGKPGKPVGSTGMSKWEISLRNWGHDPSKPNSPSNSKWKSWKKQNEEEIQMSLAKKKKASHNIISDLYQMSFKVKGGQNLRLACILCMKNIRTSSVTITPEQIESLPKDEQEKLKIDVIGSLLDDFIQNLRSTMSSKLSIVVAYIKENMPKFGRFLMGQITGGENFISKSLRQPLNKLEVMAASKLKSMAKPNSIIDFLADLIVAETPEQIAQLTDLKLGEVKDILRQETLHSENIINKVDAIGNLAKNMWVMEELRFFCANLSLKFLYLSIGGSLFFDMTLKAIGHHIQTALIGISVLMLLTDAKKTANILKKIGISVLVLSSIGLAKLIPYIKKPLHLISSAFQSIKNFFGFKNARRKVLSEAIKLARVNPQFYSMLNQRLVY